MQPRGLSKAISYVRKSVSNNTMRQTKELTREFVCQSSELPTHDPYVSVEEA
jgi:hypothetical protein